MGAVVARSLSSDPDVRDLVREAEGMGFVAEKTSGGHIKFTHPRFPDPIFTSSTPSDHRSVQNARSYLRRAVRLMEQVEATKDAITGGPSGLFVCNACAGRGKKKGFMSSAALNAHVRREHPAPPLPNTEPKEETVSEAATNVVKIDKQSKRVELGELIEWLSDHLSPGKKITRTKILEKFEGREVANTVEVLRQRGRSKRTHLNRLIPAGSGVYTWAPAHWSPTTVVPTEELVKDEPAPAKPEKVTPPAEAKGTIFEVVNQFVDGQFLVRDEEGNLFTATLRTL